MLILSCRRLWIGTVFDMLLNPMPIRDHCSSAALEWAKQKKLNSPVFGGSFASFPRIPQLDVVATAVSLSLKPDAKLYSTFNG